MQAVYRFFPAAFRQQWQYPDGVVYGIFDADLLIFRGPVQYEIRDLIAVSRVPYADTQALKVFTHVSNDIAQAIVTTVTTGGLEPDVAGLEVQLIVGDEDILNRDFIKGRQFLY